MIQSSFDRVSHEIEKTTGEIARFRPAADSQVPPSPETIEQLRKTITIIQAEMVELSMIQARARLDSITLKPLTLSPKCAIRIASDNRRDWMNARADLVDQWRKIEIVSNALESNLDLVFEGDLGTNNDRPFRFRSTEGRLKVGLQFDAPLTRLEERNDYRRTLIDYQRSRRDFYAFQDEIDRSLRSTLRSIRVAQINFEQSRAAVYSATTQVDAKQIDLMLKPQEAGSSAMGATTARDVLDAIDSLLNAQNSLLDIWVNYQTLRTTLAYNLGVLELDKHGMWKDDGSFEHLLSLCENSLKEKQQGPTPTEQIQNEEGTEEIPLPAASRRSGWQNVSTRMENGLQNARRSAFATGFAPTHTRAIKPEKTSGPGTPGQL